jgi:hypothetical protein
MIYTIKELKKLKKALENSIYKTKCYGISDIRQLNLIKFELKKRTDKNDKFHR